MKISRRRVLQSLLLGGTALAAHGSAFAREFGRGGGMPWQSMSGDVPHHGIRDERFFTPTERATVAAICASLIPSDDDGPGATEADVITFIDRQLAGFYGRGQHWYMKGPFAQGASTQGFQRASTHPHSSTEQRLPNSTSTVSASSENRSVRSPRRIRTRSSPRWMRKKLPSSERRQRPSSTLSSKTRSRAFLPIRSTAAIATWSPGNMSASQARATTIATI